MSRYIDADALLEYWEPDQGRKFDASYFIYTIECAPSIDIVRCKECKWGKSYSDKQLECDALGLGGLKFPDDFCSCGEREGE